MRTFSAATAHPFCCSFKNFGPSLDPLQKILRYVWFMEGPSCRIQQDSGCGIGSCSRAPKDHIEIRILQTMISGIRLGWGLGSRLSDPFVYVVFWALMQMWLPARCSTPWCTPRCFPPLGPIRAATKKHLIPQSMQTIAFWALFGGFGHVFCILSGSRHKCWRHGFQSPSLWQDVASFLIQKLRFGAMSYMDPPE